MPQKYTPEEVEKNLQNLPEELKEAIFSMETADIIWRTCEKQKIMDGRMTKIAEYTGYVLMGFILPEEFQKTLEKEVRIPKNVAKEITHEINRFVFFPLKSSLAKLHEIGVTHTDETGILPSEKKIKSPKITSRERAVPEDIVSEAVPPVEYKSASSKPDTYREPVE